MPASHHSFKGTITFKKGMYPLVEAQWEAWLTLLTQLYVCPIMIIVQHVKEHSK